ncbi:MAG: Holliday junction branch migration protein RuvA [Deltaproteobacteria bacterium]|nr:Holliday junction branch migration protein RuvA [Deltaproteobacteria bacterium]
MIGYLSGKILETKLDRLLLDVNGVGYEVKISLQTCEKLGNSQSLCKLFIYTHIRENALELYGFLGSEEKDLFKTLISVNGIGPKLAITILSGMPFEKLKTVLLQGNIQALSSIPGIGKKKAEKILLELKGKIEKFVSSTSGANSHCEDAVSALVNLGYREEDVRKIINKMSTNDLGVEVLVKNVLRQIALR